MKRFLWVFLFSMLVVPGQALGADECVHTSGVCNSFTQTCNGCYTTLALASSAANSTDRIILSRETHDVTTAVVISAASVVNIDENNDSTGCVLNINDPGVLRNAHGLNLEIVGVKISGQDGARSAFTIQNNVATEIDLIFDSVVFSDNVGANFSGGKGGAISTLTVTGPINLIITDSVVRGNQARYRGGAIWLTGNINFVSTRNEYSDNRIETLQSGSGGALFLDQINVFLSTDDVFYQNKAQTAGGAMYLLNMNATLTDTIVDGNECNWDAGLGFCSGAGIDFQASSVAGDGKVLTIDGGEWMRNTGHATATQDNDGGAFHAAGYDADSAGTVDANITVLVNDLHAHDNYAKSGAGFYASRYVDAILSSSALYDNMTYGHGAGAYRGGEPDNSVNTTTYIKTLFSGNKAGKLENGDAIVSGTGVGAGSYIRRVPKAVHINCTFGDNESNGENPDGHAIYKSDELGVFPESGRSDIINSIFYGAQDGYEISTQDNGGATGWGTVANNAYAVNKFNDSFTAPTNTVTLVANPFASTTDYHVTAASPAINAGAIIAGIHDQATPATDLDGTSVLTLPTIGAYQYPGGLYFNASATDGGNGTRQYPYNAWTDYAWTGYNLRAGATVYSYGKLGNLDLSGLADETNDIDVKIWDLSPRFPGKRFFLSPSAGWFDVTITR